MPWRLAGMPRYFFHIDGRRAHRDQVGEELSHDDAAWQTSMRALRELEYDFSPGEDWQLQVYHDDLPVFLIKVSSSKLR
jgi:hypothetical protein